MAKSTRDAIHFIAYHNTDTFGPVGQSGNASGGPFLVLTNKRLSNVPESRVWLVSGEGKPRRYFLCSSFVVDETGPSKRPGFKHFVKGKGVRFEPPIELTRLGWFRELLKAHQNFSLGLRKVSSAAFVGEMEKLLGRETQGRAEPAPGAREMLPVEILWSGAGGFDWRKEILGWAGRRRSLDPGLAESFIEFFRQAFEHTLCSERASFGVHGPWVSLVVGNIFLAAIVATGRSKGLWLLVDEDVSNEGVNCWPARSTQRSKAPLLWANSASLDLVPRISGADRVWRAYSRASRKVLFSPIAADRDSTQQARGKRRLSDFYQRSDSAEPTLGDAELAALIQAVAGFGDPETNRRAERAAVSYVTDWYRSRGWTVQSREQDRCGYDLECLKSGARECVEVKGVQGEIPAFIITAGELRQAHSNPDFRIFVVTAALSGRRRPYRFTGSQFVAQFDMDSLAYRAAPKESLDSTGTKGG
ncbi:MAG TPA: DUF3883 domain-containing protein [Blastocatellia bacterium]